MSPQAGLKAKGSLIESAKSFISSRILNYKKNKLQALYTKEKYLKLFQMFKKQEDYQKLTIDEFPFLFFIISKFGCQFQNLGENNIPAIKTMLQTCKFKDYVRTNDDNPMIATPIQFALLQEKEEIADLFEEQGLGPSSISNRESQNILHLSAIYRRKEAFGLSIRKGVNHNQSDIFGNTPFHYACRSGIAEMVSTMILAKAKKIVNNLHQYPIHMAVESGSLECVQLIKNDLTKPYPKFHPIHSAARCGEAAMFKYVLRAKPESISLTDSQGLTCLHHAVTLHDLEMVRAVLSNPMTNKSNFVNSQDKYGNTALHLAFLNNDSDIVQQLLKQKADHNLKNEDEMTPMDYGHVSENKLIKSIVLDIEGKQALGGKGHF